jgi:hypothetical protein
MGEIRFALCFIDCGVGPGIENPIGAMMEDGSATGSRVGQIEIGTPGGYQCDVGWNAGQELLS